jgi:hypothetical protein
MRGFNQAVAGQAMKTKDRFKLRVDFRSFPSGFCSGLAWTFLQSKTG